MFLIVSIECYVGSFDKCDICHNADNLLKATNNWSPAELEIIKAYRRQHITQQFDERIKLQQNIDDTHTLDHNGQPMKALVFGDGMTIYTGSSCVVIVFILNLISPSVLNNCQEIRLVRRLEIEGLRVTHMSCRHVSLVLKFTVAQYMVPCCTTPMTWVKEEAAQLLRLQGRVWFVNVIVIIMIFYNMYFVVKFNI
jgi:hypothetical protein